MNDEFIFRRVFYESLKGLRPDMFKNFVMALCEYALDGKEPEDGLAKGFIEIVKPSFNIEMQKEMKEDAEIWAEIMRRSEEEEAAREAEEKETWAEAACER